MAENGAKISFFRFYHQGFRPVFRIGSLSKLNRAKLLNGDCSNKAFLQMYPQATGERTSA